MAHVILLEDEPVLREELAEFLRGQGYRVDIAASICEFDAVFQPQTHQVAVLDLGLPDGDGIDLIMRLRSQGLNLGVVVLTARGCTRDKVSGLISGADHYIPKTADLAELGAVIASLSRRLEVRPALRWVLQASPRQLTPPGHSPIELSTQDYVVLKTLAEGGESVTRQAIVEALGGSYWDYDQRRLDTQMRRLRRKVLEACGLELPVSTLRSVGFSFHAPVEIRR